MSIKQLQSYVGMTNIAEEIDDETLTALGQRVSRQFKEDKTSMEDWVESVDKARDLMKQEWNFKSKPWEGASNYKDPMLTQASIQFGDKATLELLRSKDLISSEVIGRDQSGEKKERSERVTEFMNYQVNHDMNDWRGEQERVFYILPNDGCLFKKAVNDPIEKISESHVIQFPDFVVNQATKSMNQCRSFSHILDISANEYEVRVRSKLWLDIDLYKPTESKDKIDKKGDEGSNEEQGVIDAIDNDQKFIEQQTFFDLDEDDYEEPYIVTFHESSKKVVRIVARFDEKSIKVNLNDKVLELPEAVQAAAVAEVEQFGGEEAMKDLALNPPEIDVDTLKLLKIVPFQHITKYGFFNAPDGTFLNLGYSHLLGAMTQSINCTTNQLHDRGTLNNIGGGLLSKEFRKTMGINMLKQGQFTKTEVPADKMSKGIFVNPITEPSQTLFALNQRKEERAQQFMAITDNSGKINAQTAPTTALAIIQEASIATSALFGRILKAESHEFQVLFRINQRTVDQGKYAEILDDEQANAQIDFNTEGMDIVPTANAEQSSKMQRIQVATIEVEQIPMVLQTGGNPIPIAKGFFDAIGSDKIDQIYPEEGNLSPEDKEKIAAMTKAQETANELEQSKLAVQQMQLQILSREQDRLDRDTDAKVQKNGVEAQKIIEEIEKVRAEIVETYSKAALNGEKAETENLNNQITTYTANLQTILTDILGATNDRSVTQNPLVGGVPNLPGTIQ